MGAHFLRLTSCFCSAYYLYVLFLSSWKSEPCMRRKIVARMLVLGQTDYSKWFHPDPVESNVKGTSYTGVIIGPAVLFLGPVGSTMFISINQGRGTSACITNQGRRKRTSSRRRMSKLRLLPVPVLSTLALGVSRTGCIALLHAHRRLGTTNFQYTSHILPLSVGNLNTFVYE